MIHLAGPVGKCGKINGGLLQAKSMQFQIVGHPRTLPESAHIDRLPAHHSIVLGWKRFPLPKSNPGTGSSRSHQSLSEKPIFRPGYYRIKKDPVFQCCLLYFFFCHIQLSGKIHDGDLRYPLRIIGARNGPFPGITADIQYFFDAIRIYQLVMPAEKQYLKKNDRKQTSFSVHGREGRKAFINSIPVCQIPSSLPVFRFQCFYPDANNPL